MDNVTHSLTAVLLARAGLGRISAGGLGILVTLDLVLHL
jgi:hypothetical protein